MIYEDSTDRSNEQYVISCLANSKSWANYTFKKLDYKYSLDYAICEVGSNEIIGWAEIKCYKVPYSTFPTTMLSMYKCMYATQIMDVSAKPFFHIVKYSDDIICWKEIRKSDMIDLRFAGRKKERHKGNGDIEPIFYFQKSDYKIAKGKK